MLALARASRTVPHEEQGGGDGGVVCLGHVDVEIGLFGLVEDLEGYLVSLDAGLLRGEGTEAAYGLEPGFEGDSPTPGQGLGSFLASGGAGQIHEVGKLGLEVQGRGEFLSRDGRTPQEKGAITGAIFCPEVGITLSRTFCPVVCST